VALVPDQMLNENPWGSGSDLYRQNKIINFKSILEYFFSKAAIKFYYSKSPPPTPVNRKCCTMQIGQH